MNKQQVLILAMIAVWFLASWQWYTCSIKGMCSFGSHKAVCAPLLTENITRVDGNNPAEVARLQYFLNTYEHESLAENGVYGEYDYRAVQRFQARHVDDVLSPAGEENPTGNVYGYTREAINRVYCMNTGAITNFYSPNPNPMFTEPVTRAYDFSDASFEIILMLLGAFILGWLFRQAFENGFFQYLKNLVPPPPPPQPNSSIQSAAPLVVTSQYSPDDLKIVEGIGPKIEALFKAHGVKTWSDIAQSTPAKLKEILLRGGDRFALADPTSWPDQAALAVEGRWDDLEAFKKVMIAGRVK